MTDRIEKRVELSAPIERVWRAIADHEEFGSWFRVKLDQPFAPGAESTGHITYPGYEHIGWKAEIVAMEPPRLFSYRWPHMDEQQQVREDWPWTLVEFALEPTDSSTRLTVSESGFDALPPERRGEAFRMNESGWEEQMRNIAAHLAQG